MLDKEEFQILNQNEWFNELLHARGDEPDGVYCVLGGRLRFSTPSPDGRELLLTIFEPGNWLGEVSVLDGKRRENDARAIGETEVLVLPRRKFLTLLEQHPELYPHLVQMLCHKVRIALSAYHNAVFLPVRMRLALRLLELVRAYGRDTGTG